jgi:hypothetical protein
MIHYSINMKKIFILITVCFSILTSSLTYGMDSKLKKVSAMAGYGIVGGALLGTASLAFGTSGRAIAKGASLGLYAGLLFGGYMLTSYELKKRGYGESREDYYPDSSGPYENPGARIDLPNLDEYSLTAEETKKDPKMDPIFALNLLNYQF